jgi:hypothetical protein
MEGGITVGAVMQLGAWGLALGTLFFGTLGIRADRDFFLVMGCMCCAFGDAVFAYYLWEQQPGAGSGDEGDGDGAVGSVWGGGNDTMVTVYLVGCAYAAYGLLCQLNEYRLHGLHDDDEEAEAEAEAEAEGAAGRPVAPQPVLPPPPAGGMGNAGGAGGGAVKRR